MEPKLFIIRHDHWEPFVERVTDAAYEEWDNTLDRLGLNGIADINAGMFFSPGVPKLGLERGIYADEALAVPALRADGSKAAKTGKKLAKHEKGHEEGVELHKHPTKILPMLRHARTVNYDNRAGTRFLRWNDYTPPGFAVWWAEQQRLFATGFLKVQPAPPAP